YMVQIGSTNGNRVLIVNASANNRTDFFYIAGGTAKTVQKSDSVVDIRTYGMTWSKADDEFKVYLDDFAPPTTLTGLGAYAGALGSTLCNIGSYNTAPTFVFGGNIYHVIVANTVATQTQAILTIAAMDNDAFTLHHGQLDTIFGVNNWAWFALGNLDDFSKNMTAAEWHLGDEKRDTFTKSWAKIELDNTDGPDAGINDFKHIINHNMVIKSVYGATTRTHFTGRVGKMEVPDDGKQTVTLHCVGRDSGLYEQYFTLPPSVDQTATTIIQSVYDRLNRRLPKLDPSICVLDDLQRGFVDQRLGDMELAPFGDTNGITVFPYVGDSWDNALGIDIIRDAANSDQGWLDTKRDGQANYSSRHTFMSGDPVADPTE
ncbi:hypothetical protein LCGC14_2957150, partial [marine sediment metagenome]